MDIDIGMRVLYGTDHDRVDQVLLQFGGEDDCDWVYTDFYSYWLDQSE